MYGSKLKTFTHRNELILHKIKILYSIYHYRQEYPKNSVLSLFVQSYLFHSNCAHFHNFQSNPFLRFYWISFSIKIASLFILSNKITSNILNGYSLIIIDHLLDISLIYLFYFSTELMTTGPNIILLFLSGKENVANIKRPLYIQIVTVSANFK